MLSYYCLDFFKILMRRYLSNVDGIQYVTAEKSPVPLASSPAFCYCFCKHWRNAFHHHHNVIVNILVLSLRGLDLFNNKFTGTLPADINKLSNLR